MKEKLESSEDIASSYYNQIDQHFTQFIKLSQQLEELKKEHDNLQQELNKSKLTIEEQKKKIQEYETQKANSKLLFNNFMKETNEIIQKNPNLNKEEVKEVKERVIGIVTELLRKVPQFVIIVNKSAMIKFVTNEIIIVTI